MQELPQVPRKSFISLPSNHSRLYLPILAIQPQLPPAGGELTNDQSLHCMICGTFSTDSASQMVEHLEMDRSRPCAGDIIMMNGYFHCHLCPYNTNLKANFQLHTRTDKHLQRIQIVS